MRVKRWLTPPSSRPPERSRPLPPPRSSSLRLVLPPPPPLPLPPPPATILSARRFALRTSQNLPLPPRRDPYETLGLVLSQLPRISQPISPSKKKNVPFIERELDQWRRACSIAHAHLYGPLRGHREKFRNSVVRVVGHTMRLLLRLNHVGAAKELERAFFSKEASPNGRKYNLEEQEGGQGQVLVKTKTRRRKNGYGVGRGLGLERGEISIAWMQSIAVRLQGESLDGAGAREFADLLKRMRDAAVPGQPLNPSILAFLVRKLEIIHAQLDGGVGGEGEPGRKAARRQVRKVLKSIREAESNGQEIVSLAVLDGAVEKLERQVSGNSKVDMALYEQVEKEIETLVGTLDASSPLINENLHALNDLHRTLPDRESINRHSHILYLAIRFLLFRVRLASNSKPSFPSLVQSDTLSSASQLYALLLDLSPAVAHSPPDLVSLRQRQSSALYRLLWAHLGVLDPHSPSFSLRDKLTTSELDSIPPLSDYSRILLAYDLIDLTLDSIDSLPPTPRTSTSSSSTPSSTSLDKFLPSHLAFDPRLVGVSTKFHRQALYLLSLPSSPTRRSSNPSNPPPPPPWSTFQRVFETISRQRENDSNCLMRRSSPRARGGGGRGVISEKEEWELDLVVQPAFAIHLLRASLLGSGETTSVMGQRVGSIREKGGGQEGDEGTPVTRIGELIDLITRLESFEQSVDEEEEKDKKKRERKARKLFGKAVGIVVEEEWKGEGSRDWKELIKGKIKLWASNRGPIARFETREDSEDLILSLLGKP